MTSEQWRRFITDVAREAGATVTVTGGGHFRIVHPDGWFVFTARTPGDWRAQRNVVRDIKRARARWVKP